MKNRFQVWTKEPYGSWSVASPKPLGHGVAKALSKELGGSGRPIRILVLPVDQVPPEEG